MALSTVASQGFEEHRTIGRGEIFFLPGDPGVTFTRGDICSLSGGVLILGTDSAALAQFVVQKTTVCPAATVSFPRPQDWDPSQENDASKTLVPVKVMGLAAGTPVFKASVTGFVDDVVASVNTATRSIGATTGNGADDRPNEGLIYIYSGTGAGELNVIEDYDHAGGNVELEIITHRLSRAVAADAYITLSGEAAGTRGIPLFGRIDLNDEDQLHAADGADDGDYIVCADWLSIQEYLSIGQLPVIRASDLL